MVNKKLLDWIRSGEDKGYSDNELRVYARKAGYKKKDIDDALKLLKPTFNLKEFFKPSFLKLLFPVLILILTISSHAVNSVYLPKAIESHNQVADSITGFGYLARLAINKSFENNADPEEIKNLFEQSDSELMDFSKITISGMVYRKPLILGNLLIFSYVYKLNPLFPIPCELSSYEYSSLRCFNYISKEDFDYLKSLETRIDHLFSIFAYPDNNYYQKVSLADLILNSLLLLAIIYTLVCLICFVFKVFEHKKTLFKIIFVVLLVVFEILAISLGGDIFLFLIIPGAFVFLILSVFKIFRPLTRVIFAILTFIILPITILEIFRLDLDFIPSPDFSAILFLSPLIIYLSVLLFIKKENAKKISSYVALGIVAGALIITVVIASLVIERQNQRYIQTLPDMEQEYKIIYCENTKILNDVEKLALKENLRNGVWNVCYNPSCSILCEDYCGAKINTKIDYHSILRGDNPSCICKCVAKESIYSSPSSRPEKDNPLTLDMKNIRLKHGENQDLRVVFKNFDIDRAGFILRVIPTGEEAHKKECSYDNCDIAFFYSQDDVEIELGNNGFWTIVIDTREIRNVPITRTYSIRMCTANEQLDDCDPTKPSYDKDFTVTVTN